MPRTGDETSAVRTPALRTAPILAPVRVVRAPPAVVGSAGPARAALRVAVSAARVALAGAAVLAEQARRARAALELAVPVRLVRAALELAVPAAPVRLVRAAVGLAALVA